MYIILVSLLVLSSSIAHIYYKIYDYDLYDNITPYGLIIIVHYTAILSIFAVKLITSLINNTKKLKDNKLPKKETISDEEFMLDNNIKYIMTITCKLHTNIDFDKFIKYVNNDKILMVKINNKFFNKVDVTMKLSSSNIIRFALYKNGSMQFVGCNYDTFESAAKKFIKILKSGTNIYEDGTEIHIDFINNHDEIGIHDIKIQMVHANFKLDYKIDRREFAYILRTNNVSSTISPMFKHIDYEYNIDDRAIRITYYDNENKIKILVFGTGTVLICGKSTNDIVNGYKYINKILNKYKNEIIVTESNPLQNDVVDTFLE